jgi:hypothetical protein
MAIGEILARELEDLRIITANLVVFHKKLRYHITTEKRNSFAQQIQDTIGEKHVYCIDYMVLYFNVEFYFGGCLP